MFDDKNGQTGRSRIHFFLFRKKRNTCVVDGGALCMGMWEKVTNETRKRRMDGIGTTESRATSGETSAQHTAYQKMASVQTIESANGQHPHVHNISSFPFVHNSNFVSLEFC